MEAIFRDRRDAGRRLAQALSLAENAGSGAVGSTETGEEGLLVLGIPRGGVVVAAEVSRALRAPLDVIIAHKLRAPQQPELAIGAVVSGDSLRLIDEEMARLAGATPEYLAGEVAYQEAEIARQMVTFRGDRLPAEVRNKNVVVIDDGIATGYTFRAALEGVRRQAPGRLIAAVPVAPPPSLALLRSLADDVVCVAAPEPFVAVGIWYEDFTQTSDEEVIALLQENWARAA